MLITDKRETTKKFKYVGVGEVIRFVDDSRLAGFTYMAIMECHEDDGDYANLVCLNDGSLFYADDEENVEVLSVELIIKR